MLIQHYYRCWCGSRTAIKLDIRDEPNSEIFDLSAHYI